MIVKQGEQGVSHTVRHPRARVLTRAIAGCAVLGLGFGLGAGQAVAARHIGYRFRHHIVAFTPGPGPVHEEILIDANTGRVLSASNADALTYPASLTKMMTLYLTFKALDEGRLRLDTRLPVSAWAASQEPTKLGLRAGDTVSVRSLILGIVTRSANDAAVVLAEGLAGSEPAFAAEMNAEAQRLGMTRTFFANASGLPNPEQHTTARDMAQLALALYRDFPREAGFFTTKEFNFRGIEIVGHDHLMNWYPGVDGIKTGFIRASGFNLATSAVRDGHWLIGVVMGGATWASRDLEMAALLNRGFAELGVPPAAVSWNDMPSGLPPRPIPAATPVAAAARTVRPYPPARPAQPVAKAVARLAARFSPIARAEAAPMLRPKPIPVARFVRAAPAIPADWSIQIGAFRNPGAARQAARTVGSLRLARGKPLEILPPVRYGNVRIRLYRARLLRFTAMNAASACAILHKRRLPCEVVAPPIRFARR
jgi:D-alanyl-D-alanine carboxypeptidase